MIIICAKKAPPQTEEVLKALHQIDQTSAKLRKEVCLSVFFPQSRRIPFVAQINVCHGSSLSTGLFL